MNISRNFVLVLLAFLVGCASDDAQTKTKPERGPDGTFVRMVQVETSDPGARIEADGEMVGIAPTAIKVFADEDGTFHNFGSYEYTVRAFPVRPGQFVQTKVFRTGGWFQPEDRVPSRIYFDLSLAPVGNPNSLPSPTSPAPADQSPAQSKKGSGTGFVVSPDGRILTAYHVVKDAKRIRVQFADGTTSDAKVLKRDEQNDAALLETGVKWGFFVKLAAARTARIGDKVFTIGFPVPFLLGREAKYSSGELSSLSGFEDNQSLIQMTASIQPGNSGGPLFSEDGRVIGIVTSSAAIPYFLRRTGTLPQNVNWAVKSDYVMPMFDSPTADPEFDTANKDLLTKSVCLIEVE